MKTSAKGFTLLEIVIVLAIISILAAVLFPVFSRARKWSYRTTSINNLRQCGMMLRMYCDDHGGAEAMPTAQEVGRVLRSAPICDPADTWRSSCEENYGAPLVGSYGYVLSTKIFNPPVESWKAHLYYSPNPTLMVSIFHADKIPLAFQGDGPYDQGIPSDAFPNNFLMPNRVLRLRLDGSVKLERQIQNGNCNEQTGTNCRMMTWSTLF